MGLISGALSLIGGLAGGAARIAGPTAAAGTSGLIGGVLSTVGRAITSPLGGGLLGGGIGGALTSFFGGDEPAAGQVPGLFGAAGAAGILPGSPLGQVQASGSPVMGLVGGRFLATAPNGDVQVFNRHGFPVRPSQIIPAGQRMPGGSTVVSVRQGGALIGITTRRKRRTFAGEINRTRHVLAGCRAIERAFKGPKRRGSAHN